jgi:sugar (pentulose or hexulose) kinase
MAGLPVTVVDLPEAVAAGAAVQAAAVLHGATTAAVAKAWAPADGEQLAPGGDPAGVRSRQRALRESCW